MYTTDSIEMMRQQLLTCAEQWRLPEDLHIELLTVSENATFVASYSKLVKDKPTTNKIIIRVHRPNYHTPQEIESELAWLNALAVESDVDVLKPLPTINQNTIVKLPNTEHQEHLYAVAFNFLAGNEPTVGDEIIAWFEQLGKITAKLHIHSRQWQKPESFTRKFWNLDTMLGTKSFWGDWRENRELTPSTQACIEDAVALLTERLQRYGQSGDRYGLIHADLRLANLLVDGDKLQVIDFDDCGYCWFGYDFAAAISFYETDPNVPALQKSWLKGYRQCADFSAEDEAELASFILLRRILLTAWLASHSETPSADEFGQGFAEGTASLANAYTQSQGLSVFTHQSNHDS